MDTSIHSATASMYTYVPAYPDHYVDLSSVGNPDPGCAPFANYYGTDSTLHIHYDPGSPCCYWETITVPTGKNIDLYINAAGNGGMNVSVISGTTTIASQTISSISGFIQYHLVFHSTTSTVTLQFCEDPGNMDPMDITMTKAWMVYQDGITIGLGLVALSNKDVDRYRFGFNGKEKLNLIAGIGNHEDYGYRHFDTRVARFWGVDPLTNKYPMLTPFQFASNTPIWATDLDGREARIYTETKGTGHTFITVKDGDNIIAYNYGRYAGSNWWTATTTGEGVLIRYTGEKAKNYIRTELYHMKATAFEIKDVDQSKV